MKRNLFTNMRKAAREAIAEYLEECYNGYLCDLHNEVFNTDYEYTDNNEAIKALEEDGVFEVIDTIVKYEKNNFGEVNTDFTNPCKVANMLYYIIGEEKLNDMFDGCEEWDEWWNEEIGKTECKVLLAWLKDNERI